MVIQNMNQERYLTFALTKGRLADKTLKLLEQIGISCEEMHDKDMVSQLLSA